VRLARARVGQGRLVEAYEIYRKIIRDGVEPDAPDAFRRALTEAKQEVKGVEPRLAWVSVNVVGANPNEVEVQLNNAVIPSAALGAQRPVDPGTLKARATADGFHPAEVEVQLAEGEHLPAIELRMTRLPKAAATAVAVSNTSPDPVMTYDGGEHASINQNTLGYVTLGLGGAGLIVGSVSGILAFSAHEDLLDFCDDKNTSHCYVTDDARGTRHAAALQKKHDLDKYATIATVGFVAGGALAATGLILLITAPDDPGKSTEAATLRPYVGFGMMGAVGSF
jgi:pentatricopeptide repeat protein